MSRSFSVRTATYRCLRWVICGNRPEKVPIRNERGICFRSHTLLSGQIAGTRPLILCKLAERLEKPFSKGLKSTLNDRLGNAVGLGWQHTALGLRGKQVADKPDYHGLIASDILNRSLTASLNFCLHPMYRSVVWTDA